MSKKDFKKNPALSFISQATTNKEEIKKVNEVVSSQEEIREEQGQQVEKVRVMIKKEVPKGLKLNREYIETKSKRVQLLMQPSTVEGIKKIAKKNKTSMNDLINFIVKDFIENYKE